MVKPITDPDKVYLPIFGGRLAAQGGGLLAATGVLPILQNYTPQTYHLAVHEVAHDLVAPHLAWFEKHMLGLPAFAQARRKIAATSDPQAKAEVIATVLVNFAAMATAGTAGHWMTQHAVNRCTGLPEIKLGSIVALDKGLGFGLVMLGQYGLPEQTTRASDATSNVVSKVTGISPETTANLMQWVVPEAIGATIASGLLAKICRNEIRAQAARAR